MKKLILPTISVLIAALLIAVMPTDAEGAIYDDTVRLHIIAASDSQEDQALKLALRDAVLEKYGHKLAKAHSADEAGANILSLIDEIEEFAEEFVHSSGFDYSVAATLTKERYGTREYEDFTLPAGEYTSLRIIIGEGAGKNWWCVMYPPMCLGASIDEGVLNYTKEEVRLIKGNGYKVKFKILELLSEKFG